MCTFFRRTCTICHAKSDFPNFLKVPQLCRKVLDQRAKSIKELEKHGRIHNSLEDATGCPIEEYLPGGEEGAWLTCDACTNKDPQLMKERALNEAVWVTELELMVILFNNHARTVKVSIGSKTMAVVKVAQQPVIAKAGTTSNSHA